MAAQVGAQAGPAVGGGRAVPPGNATLYVGDLEPEVLEKQLAEHFGSAGAILSVRVCRDSTTKRSLGYAYVNFQNPADAEKVLATINQPDEEGSPKNFCLLGDKVIRVMPCIRDPTARKTGKGNVFIKGLSDKVDSINLRAAFADFGKILSTKVATTPEGKSKGYGFVHFEDEKAALEAVSKVNGMLIDDKEVSVELWKPQNERTQHYRNLYIKHFNKELSEEVVRSVFEQFGKIVSFLFRKDESTGEGKGFAFCAYENHDEAVRAEDLHGKEHEICAPGKTLYVARAQKKSERRRVIENKIKEQRAQFAKYTNFYVKHLDDDITSERLREVFSQFGEIVSAKVMTNPGTNTSRGFGFVCFKERRDAFMAQTTMGNHVGELSAKGNKPLYMNVAQAKDQRRQQLESRFSNPYQGGRGQGNFRGGRGGGWNGGNMGGQGMMNNFGPYGYNGMSSGAMPMSGNPMQWAQQRGGMSAPNMNIGAGRGGGVPAGGFSMPSFPQQMGFGGQPQYGMMNPMMGGNSMGAGGFPQQFAGGVPPRANPARGGMAGGFPVAGAPGGVPPQMQQRPLPTGAAPQPTRGGPVPASEKNALGERLYNRIRENQPQLAPKITGMLLEMDYADIVQLLEQPAMLREKVEEAVAVLRQHAATLPPNMA